MADCVFCKIIKKEIPSNLVYEDDKHIAFLDIGPVNPGHTLVIPKKHASNIFDMPENDLKELILVVKKICPAVLKGVEAHGLNVSINNGRAAGQLVDHIHFHIIPRFNKDGFRHWPQSKYKEGQAQEVANRIKKFL